MCMFISWVYIFLHSFWEARNVFQYLFWQKHLRSSCKLDNAFSKKFLEKKNKNLSNYLLWEQFPGERKILLKRVFNMFWRSRNMLHLTYWSPVVSIYKPLFTPKRHKSRFFQILNYAKNIHLCACWVHNII